MDSVGPDQTAYLHNMIRTFVVSLVEWINEISSLVNAISYILYKISYISYQISYIAYLISYMLIQISYIACKTSHQDVYCLPFSFWFLTGTPIYNGGQWICPNSNRNTFQGPRGERLKVSTVFCVIGTQIVGKILTKAVFVCLFLVNVCPLLYAV